MGILKNFEGDGIDNEPINAVAPIDLLTNVQQIHVSPSSSEDEDDDVHPTVIHPAAVVQATVTPAAPETVLPSPPRRAPKVKKNVTKLSKPILHVKSLGGKKSLGNRQARRHENMCFLLNLARDLDEDFASAVNFEDLVETTISAFAQLLLSKSKMKIWNEFIQLPEYQQEHWLKEFGEKSKNKSSKKRRKSKSSSSDDSDDSFVLIDNPDGRKCKDEREEAEVCFHRIDSKIRQTLKSLVKRDHCPLERISCFEDDLIPFFIEHPDSVYLRNLDHSFDRMLLHGVCQYLNLISKSITRDGERYTQVENRAKHFLPPTMLLSNYMKDFDH